MIRRTEGFDQALLIRFVKEFDFTKYENPDSWEIIGDSPVIDKVMVNGTPHRSHTSQWVEYRNKTYPMIHQSIQVPLEVFNEKFKNKKNVILDNKKQVSNRTGSITDNV